jgi:hypothetical protein
VSSVADNDKRAGVMWWVRLMLIVVGVVAIAHPVIAADSSDAGLFSKFQANASLNIVEVSPSETLQSLRSVLNSRQPKVKILSPRPDEVLQDNQAEVKLQVKDLPIFQNEDLGLGPHLHLFIDDQPYRAIYDLDHPLHLEDLAPGTHTLRVLAAYPWFESFKNQEAYAQVTFHVFTKTNDNHPSATQPLLTYNQPQDVYDAEPVMLDYYISNVPDKSQDATSPQVRVTINDTSFVVHGEKTLYLSGFKPGKNWVRLELLDRQGQAVDNVYNAPVRLIDLRDHAPAPLAQILQGSLTVAKTKGIVDPNYVPPPDPVPAATDSFSAPTESESVAAPKQLDTLDTVLGTEPESASSSVRPSKPEAAETLKELSPSVPESSATDSLPPPDLAIETPVPPAEQDPLDTPEGEPDTQNSTGLEILLD